MNTVDCWYYLMLYSLLFVQIYNKCDIDNEYNVQNHQPRTRKVESIKVKMEMNIHETVL